MADTDIFLILISYYSIKIFTMEYDKYFLYLFHT